MGLIEKLNIMSPQEVNMFKAREKYKRNVSTVAALTGVAVVGGAIVGAIGGGIVGSIEIPALNFAAYYFNHGSFPDVSVVEVVDTAIAGAMVAGKLGMVFGAVATEIGSVVYALNKQYNIYMSNQHEKNLEGLAHQTIVHTTL